MKYVALAVLMLATADTWNDPGHWGGFGNDPSDPGHWMNPLNPWTQERERRERERREREKRDEQKKRKT